jgi:hypothetical protein
VSLGTYATVQFVLGMIDRVAELADVTHDAVGLELEEEHLPQRIRFSPNRGPSSLNPRVPTDGKGCACLCRVARDVPPGGKSLGARAQGAR